MKYSIQITVVCFIGFSVSSPSMLQTRKGRNLSFSNILKNYLTKYPAFKEKSSALPLENRQNRRKFPYKIVQPSPLNHQKIANNHFSKYSENQFKNKIHKQQNPNKNVMQNRGAAFIQNFRESSNVPNIFDKFSNDVGFVGSPSFFTQSASNMVRNSDLESKSTPADQIPKQMPEVTRNEEIKESAWISWSPKPSSPSSPPPPPPPPPPQLKRNGGFYHGQDDYKVVWFRRFSIICLLLMFSF